MDEKNNKNINGIDVTEKDYVPESVAVHTRDTKLGKDYAWYVKPKTSSLFDDMEDIYRIALRDISGAKRPLALIEKENSVGLMICDMPSERIDQGNRRIFDTLYMEFDEEKKQDIFQYIAYLVSCTDDDYEIIKKNATEYAEKLYENSESILAEDFKNRDPYFIKYDEKSDQDYKFDQGIDGKYVLLFSKDNSTRCANFLKEKPAYSSHKNRSFVFISTGRAGRSKCEQIADKYDKCLILSESSEIKDIINLKKKKHRSFILINWPLLLIIGLILLHLILRVNTFIQVSTEHKMTLSAPCSKETKAVDKPVVNSDRKTKKPSDTTWNSK
jgi:hypothetical protein